MAEGSLSPLKEQYFVDSFKGNVSNEDLQYLFFCDDLYQPSDTRTNFDQMLESHAQLRGRVSGKLVKCPLLSYVVMDGSRASWELHPLLSNRKNDMIFIKVLFLHASIQGKASKYLSPFCTLLSERASGDRTFAISLEKLRAELNVSGTALANYSEFRRNVLKRVLPHAETIFKSKITVSEVRNGSKKRVDFIEFDIDSNIFDFGESM